MSETHTTHPTINYGAVFWSLFVLTILEIGAASLPIPKIAIVLTLIFLALLKAGLVAFFYMHLKFEKFLIYLIVIFPLILAVILTVMTLLDKPPTLMG